MSDQKRAECRSCKATIFWAVSDKSGSPMPLDFEPVEGGNIVLLPDGRAHTISGELFEGVLPEGPRYRSHFASCPNHAQHRKPKKKE